MRPQDLSTLAGIEELWSETRGDRRVAVAVLDGPVDRSHRSLRAAALEEIWQVTPCHEIAYRHGTYITSIIFGQHDGPVLGVAPLCRGLIVPIFRGEDTGGRPVCSQEELGHAIEAAVRSGAHIINISAGDLLGDNPTDPILAGAVATCVAGRVLLVAAAGNQGHSHLQVPSALPGVLAVGAMNARGERLASSNWSEALGVCGVLAPGEGIAGALPGDQIGQESGTSCASAIVAGVAALLMSLQLKAGASIEPRQVREVLIASATRGSLNIPAAAALLKQRLGTPGAEHERRRWWPGATYTVNPQSLNDRYGGVSADKFGTTDVTLPDGRVYNVQDLWYPVGSGRLGIRIVPASDERPSGSSLIDDILRQEMGLKRDEPIYAFLSYIRPEEHSLTLFELAASQKLQLGHQHLGAYLGEGRTSHILPRKSDWKGDGPLNMMWNVDRYPANVQVISLHGVPQATINRNAQIVGSILASKGQAPADSQTLTCRTIDINTTLQFYRDVILRADYLEDLSWFTNCAVHSTIVVNAFLNVPHNQAAFEQIFGGSGAELWQAFKRYYQGVNHRPFGPDDETHFQPLWRLAGLTAQEVAPLSFREYNAYQAAKREGRLDEFTGPRPLDPGRGLAWPLETVIDLVARLLETYVSVEDAGGVNGAALLLALRHRAVGKLGLPADMYVQLVKPIVAALLAVEAAKHRAGDRRRHLTDAAGNLEALIKQVDAGNHPNAAVSSIAGSQIRELVNIAAEQLAPFGGAIANRSVWFRNAIEATLTRLRRLSQTASSGTGLFSTPSIIHQIARGLHPSSPFVKVRSICTVMDARELVIDPSHVAVHGVRTRMPDLGFERNERGELDSMADTRMPLGAPAAVTPSVEGINATSCDCGCKSGEDPARFVYALGQIGYDFGSDSRLNSFRQKMGLDRRPDDPRQFLEYLDTNPHDASAVQWLLNVESTPIYTIEPAGPFAREAYELLRRFLREQLVEGVERVSIPGTISGTRRLRSGAVVPAIQPEVRGMYSWTTAALVTALTAQGKEKRAKSEKGEEGAAPAEAIRNFLDRVYYQIRNVGRTPEERAINYAATNAFEIGRVYEQAIREEMELDTVEVTRSPLSKPGSDCWDVSLVFFYPGRQVQTVRKVYRFTVDVADVVPSTIGQPRSWFIR